MSTPSIASTPTPTTVSFLGLPLESVRGEPMGATFGITAQGKGINETVSFYVDGTYAGQATTSTSGTGEFIFPSSPTSGLTLGHTHLPRALQVTRDIRRQHSLGTLT